MTSFLCHVPAGKICKPKPACTNALASQDMSYLVLMWMGTLFCFSAILQRRTTFVTSCLLPDEALPKWSPFLTLLHSGRPRLYGVLAFLSAIGLKERVCSYDSKFFPSTVSPLRKAAKSEIGRVASPESSHS